MQTIKTLLLLLIFTLISHANIPPQTTYNETNQLSNDPNGNNTTTTFTYDAVGNILTKTINGTSESYSYNANDQLIQKGSITYTYDSNGNLISDGTNSYSYDDKNRLIKAVTPNETIEYTYDANDNRIAKTTNNGTTTYLVDANTPFAQVITESKSDGTEIKYTYGNDLLTQSSDADTLLYLTDAIGSTRALADSVGTITDNYTYSPYGALLEHLGSSDNEFLFTGEQYGFEDGLYYLRARYYNPINARFMSRDTYDGKAAEPVTQNHYLYGGANPLTYVDPSGHFFGLSGIGAALSIMSDLSALRTTRIAVQIYGRKGLVKMLACGAGVSYIKKQYRYDGLQGHHAIPKNIGGHPTKQDLLYIPANTHRMFHWVLNLFLKMDPSLKGYGNWTSSKNWEEITQHKWGRIALYEAILKSSYVVDRVCRLKRPLRLRDYVRKYKKEFIEGAW